MKKTTLLFLFLALSIQSQSQQWYSIGVLDTIGSINGKPFVFTINSFNNKMVIGGYFKYTGTTVLNSVAQWNGNQWLSMSTGVWTPASADGAGSCKALIEYHNILYCAGGFSGAGGTIFFANHYAYNIAKWNNTDWLYMTQPTDGFDNGVAALGLYHNNLYIGHSGGNAYDSSGATPAQGIAKWNDTVFSAVGQFSGDFPVWGDFFAAAFTNYNNKLIVGGYFTSINGSTYGTYSGIAAWDDTVWSTMGNGFNNAVLSLTVFNGEVYAGGCFTSSRDGTTPLNHIAKWNGTTWELVGEGLSDTVYTLTIDSIHNKLYAGGAFTQIGLGVQAKYIAEWTGTNWQEVGGGTNRTVRALYAKDSNLYVGGFFTKAGNVQASLIACWCVNNPTGVGELAEENKENGIYIYPNPTSGIFTITTEVENIKEIKIYNVLGEIVFQTTTQNSKAIVDISDRANGIYFIEIRTTEGTVRKKLIKE